MTTFYIFLTLFLLLLLFSFLGGYIIIRGALQRGPDKDKDDTQNDDFSEQIKENIAFYYVLQKQGAFSPRDIKSDDGLHLYAELLPAKNDRGRTIICVHGYTGSGERDCAAFVKYFYERNFSVLLIDLRAHGKSEGKNITFGVKDRFDLKKWCEEMLLAKPNEHIYLHGVSMGAATVQMAVPLLHGKIRGVIADCGFTTPYEQIKHTLKNFTKLPLFPFFYTCRILCNLVCGWDFKGASATDSMRENTDVPMLFVHGGEDTFVPTEMGRINFNACNAPKRLFIAPNSRHPMSYYDETDNYEREMDSFFSELCGEDLRASSVKIS